MFALTPFYDRRGRDPFALAPVFEDPFFQRGFSDSLAPLQDFPKSNIAVDLMETEHEVKVTADIPQGFKKEDVHLNIDNNILTITAESKTSGQEDDDAKDAATPTETTESEEGVRHHLRERSAARRQWAMSRKVSRSIRLPHHVDASKAAASLENGTLSIQLPKVSHVNTITIA
mmetsp:Transcript_4488/g.17667  ORF Transcript_4488/g.17667 Transcript_4488/m.17667 type:complete len:174 (-) Transcript_4488:777-1298(-)